MMNNNILLFLKVLAQFQILKGEIYGLLYL